MSRLATPTFATRAIVLRSRPLGERDRALTLLCEDGAKLSASARGARGTKSKLAAVSQPFLVARLLLARGKTFAIVQQAEIENAHSHIVTNLQRATWAAYCCELCDALPEDLPEAGAFALLEVALGALDAAPLQPADVEHRALEAVGRWFEAHFLALLGYAPQLGRCLTCERKIVVAPEEGARKLAFSPTMGGTLCSSCAARDAGHLEARTDALRTLHKLERSSAPPLAERWELGAATRRDLRDVLRASLRAHLGVRLRSQRLLDEFADEISVS